jgi:hypothetical protein
MRRPSWWNMSANPATLIIGLGCAGIAWYVLFKGESKGMPLGESLVISLILGLICMKVITWLFWGFRGNRR